MRAELSKLNMRVVSCFTLHLTNGGATLIRNRSLYIHVWYTARRALVTYTSAAVPDGVVYAVAGSDHTDTHTHTHEQLRTR